MRVKYLLAGVVALCVVSVLVSSSYAKIDPKTVVGMWLFDEGKDDVARDVSENKNDGTVVGDFEWMDGKYGKALELDGETSHVEVPLSESLNITDQITIAFWIQPQRVPAIGDERIMAKSVGADTVNYQMYIRDRLPRFEFNSGGWKHSAGKTALEEGQWYHLAGIYDGTDQKLYVNAVVEATGTRNVEMVPNEAPLYIGFDQRLNKHFKGIIDDFVILNVALTGDDINNLMTSGLDKVFGISPVDATGKLTTTWAGIKARD
jgi:hypothetical protein